MSAERLATALADRYRVERELGQAGRSTLIGLQHAFDRLAPTR